MSDLDSTDLARDLFERLAATMPDNPQRVSAVRQLVRRRHRRRVATRATIGLACVAGVGAVLMVGTSKRSEPVTAAAPGQTNTTASSATSATTPDPCQVKAATVGGGGSTTIPSSDGHFKGGGTVTAIDGDVISVAVHDASIPLTQMRATIAPDAKYTSARVELAARPAIAVGQQVRFGAIAEPDGSYVIDLLEVLPVDTSPSSSTDQAKTGSTASLAPNTTGPSNPGCPPAG